MKKITLERLKEILRYEPETGLWFWLVWSKGRRRNLAAGNVDSDGYNRINIDGTYYRCGRIAWLYMIGVWPPETVDHDDTNRSNDRWVNLRLAIRSQNQANRNIPCSSTSGLKGVTWDRRGKKWRAAIKVNRKTIHLGSYLTPEEAHVAYCTASVVHFGNFARST